MGTLDDLKRDISKILATGVNHTGRMIELLQAAGWSSDMIVPAVYQLIANGTLDPKGRQVPYRAN
jgi:hypothetical protein